MNEYTQTACGRSSDFEPFLGGFRGDSGGIPRGFRGIPQGFRGIPGDSACATAISFATSGAGGSSPIIILKGETQKNTQCARFTSEGF